MLGKSERLTATRLQLEHKAIAAKGSPAQSYTTMQLTVSKLPRPEHCGDWHDRPLRWIVTGAEIQKFSTKRDAQQWAKCRRGSASFTEACNRWQAIG